MIQDFYDNHIFLYIMGGLCGFGVFLKCFLLVIYNKLIKASECMTNTNKNWLKNMRLRFESSYQLQLGVNDVDTYVDKYVSKIKYGGLLLSTWENISGQTIGLCLLTGSFAGILGFVYECGQGPVLFTFFAGAWTAIIVNIVDNVVNISAHKQMLRYNLIDYFENNLKVRMEQEIYHPEARRKYQRQYFDELEDTNEETNIAASQEMNVTTNKKADKVTKISDHTDLIEIEPENTKVIQVKEEMLHSITSKKEEKATSKKEILDAKVSDKKAKKEAKSAEKQARLDAIAAEKQAMLDAKSAKKQAKLDAKAAKKQAKMDAKAAKKKEKQDAKQAKLDAIQAKKQAKLDNKQLRIDEKNANKKAREDAKIAKEKAIIEDMLAKKNAKDIEREEKEKHRKLAVQERERLEKESRQKELENNKAYKEKMRLKQEKEREAAKKKVELQLLERAKDQERKQKEEVALADKFDEDKIDLEAEENEFEHMAEAESLAMTATSKEEDALIEEVLKDFLF